MKKLLTFKGKDLFLGDEPFYIASGDMHYFRFFKEGWERRLRLMKDFGLTCVQTYVPWNLHEAEKGQYDFSGNLDLSAFLSLCKEVGLYVLLRPSPYMCGEWDLGGLPYWLLKDKTMDIRSNEKTFMSHVREYTERLSKEFIPHLSTNGGPVIAVAVENEYGSYGNDTTYIKAMADMLIDLGVDVPLFTANGEHMQHIKWGSLPELWTGIDAISAMGDTEAKLLEFQGEKPLVVFEQWAGSAIQWGGVFNKRKPEAAASLYKESLDRGYMVNFYMFCGGTNFGFTSGANFGVFRADVGNAVDRYIPFTTSYDVDAPVSEEGRPTEKYYELKKVLCEHLGTEYVENKYEYKSQKIDAFKLKECGSFFDSLKNLATGHVFSSQTKTMEELSQDYGFILYETDLEYLEGEERILQIDGLSDRATVYGNGEYLGTLYRDRPDEVRFSIPKGGMRLSILVENMGRICFGNFIKNDYKGIKDCVRLDRVNPGTGKRMNVYALLMNWDIYTLPLKDISMVSYNGNAKENMPTFYKGTFKAKPGVDTFFKAKNLKKGVLWINGFNLGRYWEIGPQETLYVPGELLKEENTIEIFELYGKDEAEVEFSDEPSLDTIRQNVETLVQAARN